MRLRELGTNLPKKAGKAILDFYPPSKDGSNPITREKKVISMPAFTDLELFPLEPDWNTFLVVLGGWNAERTNRSLYFGGTDENPFLVRMNPMAIGHYYSGGAESFLDAIRPAGIKRLEESFQREARRQGDIFAIESGYSWDELAHAADILASVGLDIKQSPAIELFQTRHVLHGQHAELNTRNHTMLFISGKVVAPDHADLELTVPYIVEQTALLYDPPRAD